MDDELDEFLTVDEVTSRDPWPRFVAELVAQGRVQQAPRCDGSAVWVAVDRRELFEPQLPASDQALVEIVRGRLEGLGPVTVSSLAQSLVLPMSTIAIALSALEAEGFAMHGRYMPGAGEEEWCERRLLARIHRYTVKRLRAEIEPVAARDFLRFLFDWQRVLPGQRMQGADAVAAALSQLEGFEAPAGAWESDILPSRIKEYDPHWLDEHCRAGRFVWARLAGRKAESDKNAGPIRSTPIALLARRNVKAWSGLTHTHDPLQVSYKPRAVYDFLRERGASFFDDIADGVSLLPVEVEDALADLVSLGLVNSDSFGGLRALLMPSSQRSKLTRGRRGRRFALFGMADAGRWAIVRREPAAATASPRPDEDAVEHIVRSLLRRWGVIFWKLLAREADWLPSWRDILTCCRRLEARGEIRGGRFIAGFAGEQFADPTAVGLLRETRRRGPTRRYISVSGADPLNLLGIVTPGARVPSLTGNRLLYLDGLPIAVFTAGEVIFLETLEVKDQWEAKNAILRRHVTDGLLDLESES